MNGEGPSVPITTLAGIQSLTDLLLELPLPTPLPGATGHQSLLSHLRDSEEARRFLNAQDTFFASPLIEALSCTTTDHIEVKDGYYGGAPHGGQISQLVQLLLSRNPSLFKGVVHSPASIPADHHTSSASSWLQRPCSTASVHHQQPVFTTPAVSPCQNQPSQGNSPGYFPIDPASQSGRHVHNKSLNLVQPKSPISTYPQFAHAVPTGQQHSVVHHNAISQVSDHHLSSVVQENPQMFSSPAVNQAADGASQTSTVHSFSNGNCVEDIVAASPAKPNSRTENHIVKTQHLVGNAAPNCSPHPALQNATNDASLSSPPSSSSSTPQHVNSSSVIVAPGVQNSINCKKQAVNQQPKSSTTPTGSSRTSLSKISVIDKDDVNKTTEHKKESSNTPVPVNKSVICKNTPKEDVQSKEQTKLGSASSVRWKPTSEVVVVLSKLTVEEQVLAQKSVKQFKLKNRKCSPEPPKSSSRLRNSENTSHSTRRRSSNCSEVEAQAPQGKSSSSPRKKVKNNEISPNKKNAECVKEKSLKRSHREMENGDSSAKPKGNSSSLGERVKKRRRISQQATYVESPTSNRGNSDDDLYKEAESPPPAPVVNKAKKVKAKKVKKEAVPLSVEDLMDSNTYQHFSRTVEAIFDSMEDIDFSAEIDEDAECPAEALIPLHQLQDLCNEAAKLKMLHAMNQFPPERLVRLLTILERNILDGAKLLPIQNMDEQDEEEARLWLELTMERVMRSADASLTALYIMTSPKMPEKVFLEDVIERIVVFLKFQLQNTVFPVFDPAYRLDPKSKDGYVGNIKQKRAHAHKVKEKSTIQLYNKLHEAVSLLAELLEVQALTDTIILQVSTLGVSPFFVEGVSELQLNALRLVTSVFARYDKHRQLILEDILASIARLPTSKRSLRNYRLNSEENIQMLTALVLQLIHSVVRLPEPEIETKNDFLANDEKNVETKDKVHVDKDVLIITSYEASVRTAVNFLSVFLKKCGTKNEEMDYRPLFENFVQDLLSTVNKPEWPASELLLSLLGKILVQNFSNKSMEMTLRVASLDYLGVVAARLRKDAVSSQLRKEMINDIIKRIMKNNEDSDNHKSKKSKNKVKPSKPDETQVLQKTLLQYLDANMESDPALQFSRRFYIAQWFRDAAVEIRKNDKSYALPKDKEKDKEKDESQQSKEKHKSNKAKRLSRRSSQVNYDVDNEEEEEEEEKEEKPLESEEVNARVLALAEERKRFLLTAIKRRIVSKVNTKDEEHIDYKTAELISRFLASTRHFSQSFDIYLSQILRVLSETAVAVRTKAMKCLALVVEADPSILARPDMQRGVHGRLLDQSTSVREAAVDLVGKFILIRPELTSQYYEMLTDRILDTGVSVRKRVIKILKDVCLEQPDFPKTPEICVKIIRRVNDEDGIKKLVGEVFQSMWFTPVSEKQPDRILQRVKNITHVVAACKDSGLEWFEQLLTNLLKNKEDGGYKGVVKSCRQIVNCLVENVLQLEESSQNSDGGASQNLVACLTTLYLFSKIHPSFVVPHATTIQPYLSMKCNTHSDYLVLQNVARTLELVVPLIEHPSESFLAQIEEDMVKLILRHGMMILPSCVSCLGAVVNRVTRNYQLVRDCFQKFFVVLLGFKKEHEKNPDNLLLHQQRPKLLRSLFTVGLFCRHFDFDTIEAGTEQNGQKSLKGRVFESMIYFNQHEDEDIRYKALTGLGFLLIRHYEFMLGPEVKALYQYLLTCPTAPSLLKCQVLKNLTAYLTEEEERMIQKDAEWSKVSKNEDLKEMGDVTSGMASTVIQIYLKQILESALHEQVAVRKAALHVIQLILGQGLVHPVQIVPYLVCLGSDDNQIVRTKADQLLQEIEKKYPGFIQMKAMSGVRMSFKIQQLIQDSVTNIRGFRATESPVSRNGFLYSVIRGTRQSRRAFLLSLLKLFDEQAKTPLTELLYIADNIVYFPYQVQDEPLFIMHQIDIMLSVSGSNLLQSFREALMPHQQSSAGETRPPDNDDYDDDDDDYDAIHERLPEDTSILQECIIASQGCVLLLYIKQTLKEMYGFTDNKIQQYSPNEAAKVYERPLNRKGHVRFKPQTVLNFIKSENFEGTLDEKGKEKLIHQYLNFKQLMLTIDPSEDDDDDDDRVKQSSTLPLPSTNTTSEKNGEQPVSQTVPETPSSEPAPPKQPAPEKPKVVISRKSKSPTRTPRSHKKVQKISKEKIKKKHKKRRRRVIASESDNSDSDPDYVDSS